MAFSPQTSFTASLLTLNAATRRFWYGVWGMMKRQCMALGHLSRRIQRRCLVVLLGVITLLLTLASVPSSAQTPPTSAAPEAPVVLDGRVLFKVRNSGNFTAAERAEIINDALEQEMRSSLGGATPTPEAVKLEVVQENQLTIIRSSAIASGAPSPEGRDLMTLSEGDVIPGTSLVRQANIWRDLMEKALRQGKLERTPGYSHQALLFSMGV